MLRRISNFGVFVGSNFSRRQKGNEHQIVPDFQKCTNFRNSQATRCFSVSLIPVCFRSFGGDATLNAKLSSVFTHSHSPGRSTDCSGSKWTWCVCCAAATLSAREDAGAARLQVASNRSTTTTRTKLQENTSLYILTRCKKEKLRDAWILMTWVLFFFLCQVANCCINFGNCWLWNELCSFQPAHFATLMTSTNQIILVWPESVKLSSLEVFAIQGKL